MCQSRANRYHLFFLNQKSSPQSQLFGSRFRIDVISSKFKNASLSLPAISPDNFFYILK